MSLLRRVFFVLLALFALRAQAAPLSDAEIPPALKPWMPWVLHGEEARRCPLLFNSSDERLCNWPSKLTLDLKSGGGSFDYNVRVYAPGWLNLPGDAQTWPQDVRVDNAAAPVTQREETPAIWLGSGEYRVSGRFIWKQLPETLRVSADTALIELSINGQRRSSPARDERGQLWLGKAQSTQAASDNHVSLKVYRLLDDAIPFRVTTHIDLEVAGAVRDEVIGPVLLPGLIPLSLSGGLPARLDDDGRLHVQLRPGVWSIEVVARASAPVSELKLGTPGAGWPQEEIWSLLTRNELRTVNVSGAPALDPRQTQMPEPWRGYAAYQMKAGGALQLAEQQRGNAHQQPDEVQLTRQLWLDFDGEGYSLRDELSGRINKSWRLDAAAPLQLGRVQVDGQPQLITAQGENGQGVEVRRGALTLSAESRIDEDLSRLPAAGWNLELQGVNTTLHLPPGWRLLAAPGADNVPQTWISRWTLLDLFVVLIASIAAARMFGRGIGALTLVTLALIWHEPDAPRWAWLNLIATIALIKALPESARGGALMNWLRRYRWIAAAGLLLIVIPFAIQQARSALYPQLENQYSADRGAMLFASKDEAPAMPMEVDADGVPDEGGMPAPAAAEPMQEQRLDEAQVAGMKRKPAPQPMAPPQSADSFSSVSKNNVSQQSLQQLAPNVLTQTGAGLPDWQWDVANLSWSGPVTVDQSFRLWLLAPWETRLLRVLALILIALLLARLLELPRIPLPPLRAPATASLLLLAMTIAASGMPRPAMATEPPGEDLPAPGLLEEFKQRLLAAPECAEACADIARMQLSASADTLTLRLSVDALTDVALPLPVPLVNAGDQGSAWQPQSVIADGRAAHLQRSDGGALMIALLRGRHELVISGALAGHGQLQLPLGLRPHRVDLEVKDWLVTGVSDEGVSGDAIQLVRVQGQGRDSGNTRAQQALPPLLIVVRTLHLGLSWDVETQVQREGTTHLPSVVHIGLLPGEILTGEQARAKDGRAEVSFAPNQRVAGWNSRLPITPSLQLQAAKTNDYVEVWRLDVSPLWHVDLSGIAPVTQQEANWWLPSFQPWPEETLSLKITRPAGVQGQALTLDNASLSLAPGQRASDATLQLKLRASQAGQHALTLPEGIGLQSLDVDGVALPPRLDGQKLTLSLHPGEQNITLQLRDTRELPLLLHTPQPDLGLPGVNARITMELPQDRWILLAGGPRLGPAVLFWGVLAVLLLIAAALGRLPYTPLNSRQWMLFMVGLSQLPVWGAALVTAWLFALGARGRADAAMSAHRFNAMQAGLVLLSLVALALLFQAVALGLLGAPDMQITGNGSFGNHLQWYQDRYDGLLPGAWVLSVPLWVYRLLMLAWALWLANALLNWLRWGWAQYSAGGLWKKAPPRIPAGSKEG